MMRGGGGGAKSVLRGFATSRFVKSMLEELLFGSADSDISNGIRNDNPIVVEHAHAVN